MLNSAKNATTKIVVGGGAALRTPNRLRKVVLLFAVMTAALLTAVLPGSLALYKSAQAAPPPASTYFAGFMISGSADPSVAATTATKVTDGSAGIAYVYSTDLNATDSIATGALGEWRDASRIVFYTGTKPTRYNLQLTGLGANLTAQVVPNVTSAPAVGSASPALGNSTSTSLPTVSFPVTGDTESFQLVFRTTAAGTAIVQRIYFTVAFVHVAPTDFFGGTQNNSEIAAGSAANPFLITEAEHLDNIRMFPNSHFLLDDDIDLSSYYNKANNQYAQPSADKIWRTIGYSHNPAQVIIDRFTGSFTGPLFGGVPQYTINGFTGDGDISKFATAVATTQDKYPGGGLFNVYEGAEIGGFKLTNVSYKSAPTASSAAGVLATSFTNTRIRDIEVSGTYENGMTGTGGLAATATYGAAYVLNATDGDIANVTS
ncbi:MAG: hypothetical protein LBM78_03285, partial [Clostridiales bacterium]|nr:hypothetical protein [Clostridiales bacterium]